jgi:hypothetical protein
MADWYDPAATLAAVLATLRLQSGDVDADRIADIIPAVAAAIEQWCDRVEVLPGPPAPADLQQGLEGGTIAQYQQEALVATIGGGVSSVTGATAPFDPLADVYVLLVPYKQQWAVA